MTNITAALVKDLRDKTGAGMMDCKNALTETGGDMEAAIDWLRKKGISKAGKKAGRVAAEGLVGVAVSGGAVIAPVASYVPKGSALLIAQGESTKQPRSIPTSAARFFSVTSRCPTTFV